MRTVATNTDYNIVYPSHACSISSSCECTD